jgi:hypothetical protein
MQSSLSSERSCRSGFNARAYMYVCVCFFVMMLMFDWLSTHLRFQSNSQTTLTHRTHRYSHGLGAVTSITHLLPHFEHLASPMAVLAASFATEYESPRIVGDVMRCACVCVCVHVCMCVRVSVCVCVCE